ncbi:TLP18.3, Psb32 and MOLO-1 founding protein of phosphatase, partial [Streptomyces sp. Termitarium-T10T-6]
APLAALSAAPLAALASALLAALASALLAVGWLVLPAAVPARADDPVELSRDGQITDRVGALGDRAGQVEDALDRLYDEQRVQLFVVYVRDFSGRSVQTWSDETADRNGLGQDDVLLSVATHDRQYAYSVDVDSRLTDADLREVAGTAIEPALRENDWAGAAIGAADGYASVLAGRPVTAPPSPRVPPTPERATPAPPAPATSSFRWPSSRAWARSASTRTPGADGARRPAPPRRPPAGAGARGRGVRRSRRRRCRSWTRRRNRCWWTPMTPYAPARRNSDSPPPSSARRRRSRSRRRSHGRRTS